MRFLSRFFFLVLVFLTANAWATPPEDCGNGVDDGASSGTHGSCGAGYTDALFSYAGTANTGCDLKCPELDKDNDGYNSTATAGNAGTNYKDCDDNNRLIFPGNYYACDCGTGANSGYHLCQTDGTYGTCTCTATTVLCEKTGTGVCKYINADTGDDTNAGTYAAPYKTLGKVAGGSVGTPPASPYTLQAGDVVYLVGNTNHTTQYSDGSANIFAQFAASGDATNKIRIKRYPGSTASITAASGRGFNNAGSSYYIYEDLDFDIDGKNIDVYGNYIEIKRCYFHDGGMSGNDNESGVYINSSTHANIHHNFFKDIFPASGNAGNVGCVNIINDHGTGGDHTVNFNTMWYTASPEITECVEDAMCGDCVRMKHGTDTADAGTNTIAWNSMIQCNLGATIHTSNVTFKRNKVIHSIGYGIKFDGSTDATGNEGEVVEYNTFLNSQGLEWSYPSYTVNESVIWRHNVISDNLASYTCGLANAPVRIDPYGSDAQLSTFETGTYLTAEDNCYYNASTAVLFDYYCVGAGGGGHGPAGAAGDIYSFANWKATEGYDTAGSYEENPTFDSYYRATAANCDDKGWLLTSEEPAATSAVPAIMSTLD